MHSKAILLLATLFMVSGVIGCQSIKSHDSLPTNNDIRIVKQVEWDKTGKPFTILNDADLNNNESRVVFVRAYDQDSLQTSVNVGIDNLFQVSLQPGQFSQAVTCSGVHSISAEVTGKKNNRLTDSNSKQKLVGQITYYYLVDVNDAGQASISLMTRDQALTVLNNPEYQSQEQTHQISRVADSCVVETPQSTSLSAPQLTPLVKPKLIPVIAVIPKIDDSIVINAPIKLDVLFDLNSANIQVNDNQRLESIAEFMQLNTDRSAVLEGHTDNLGDASYNLRLSEDRAKAVKTLLVNKYGINANRLNTVGYGESQPMDNNSTAKGRHNNRRVVAIIN
ncbi:OmpA family protein [Psychrobacter sp. BF1]|uniref:OmpA family protein n=1 Tax=Psychrobacter sp. BF1 TaxID=2821147 RepID=UPI001C4DE5BD|nr:OmpA family protein [Psychrobacter sp. BF1]